MNFANHKKQGFGRDAVTKTHQLIKTNSVNVACSTSRIRILIIIIVIVIIILIFI